MKDLLNFKKKASSDIIEKCKTESDISNAFKWLDIYLHKTQDIGGYEEFRKTLLIKEKSIKKL